MKKYIAVFTGLVLGLSIAVVAAQSGTVSGSTCVEYVKDANGNNTTQCARWITGSIGTGVNTGGAGVNTGGAPGGASINQGQNTYRPGSNAADLSFFGNLIAGTGGLIKMLPPILLGAAVVVFFFFLIKYFIASKGDPAEKKKQLTYMMNSLIAIFVMVALWGIIAFVANIAGINTNVGVTAPSLPTR